ncbi:glycosyltransferase family 4 protein [Paenarthrobacter ureafaciens]|uniref:glycosyltransferase family 4 protein n=1 Tax=Paenarthrobacter ureafaciens TaxID=37931 RepID=UPI002270E269|nr:glycosyltransferase family 4 protein [Paenarthrobacter ureafaciens]MCY0975608.1 glycosyltransferase family 4 protein [Paenarthrobacter ureafaciens]
MKKKIAIFVPEYRTAQAREGGLSSVADFVVESISAFTDYEWTIVSPRMAYKAEESQRLLAPRTWGRGVQSRQAIVSGKAVVYVGSHLAEFEQVRFMPRKALTSVLEDFDAIVAVAGTPASFVALERVTTPVLGQVATTLTMERRESLSKGRLLRRLYRRANLALSKPLDKRGVKVPSSLLVENAWMQSWCEALRKSDVQIAVPGVDTDYFTPADESQPRPGIILSTGRLNDPRKNHKLLVDAYTHAVNVHGVRQKLVIAGLGELEEGAAKSIAESGIQERITVLRNVSRDDLRDLYRSADFFALSSSEEGLGIVLMEAMACGLPFISTATEGAKSIVAISDQGEVVELDSNSTLNFADSLARYAKASPETLAAKGAKCRQAAQRLFSIHNTGKTFLEEISRLLELESAGSEGQGA